MLNIFEFEKVLSEAIRMIGAQPQTKVVSFVFPFKSAPAMARQAPGVNHQYLLGGPFNGASFFDQPKKVACK